MGRTNGLMWHKIDYASIHETSNHKVEFYNFYDATAMVLNIF